MAAGHTMRLPPLPSIKEIIRLYKLRAMKQLSQNFLLDRNLTNKIVRAAGNIKDGYVCEVGPGPGGITRSILESGVRQLIVVEKDRRFLPGLELLKEASKDRMKIYQGDILHFNTEDLFPPEAARPWSKAPPNLHIIGNLPFNVSTPLIIRWLEAIANQSGAWRLGRVSLTLTFQKEVAERMVAPIMHEQRCRLSVMCQYLCDVRHLFTVPGRVFEPSPDVDVGVVRFVPLMVPKIEDVPFKMVEKFARHAFHFRQKMFKRGLETLFPGDRPDLTREMVSRARVPPQSRCFMLTMEEIARLCRAYKELCDENPGLIDYDYRDPSNEVSWSAAKLPLNL